eukprot:508532-Rhodomonas_salina.4
MRGGLGQTTKGDGPGQTAQTVTDACCGRKLQQCMTHADGRSSTLEAHGCIPDAQHSTSLVRCSARE